MSSPPVADRGASIEFLRWFSPTGPWCLTAIPPEGGSTTTRTFRANEEPQVVQWLAGHGALNLYFAVNPVKGLPTKKCTKEDVAALAWVHVDVDPADGCDVAVEQERIRTLLLGGSPGGLPLPSCVTFSGGGYQAFWRLEEPVPIRDKAHAELELELHARHAIAQLGGDKSCFNVDRIMRLPGSVNWPSERKRKKGRTTALAAVVVKRPTSHSLADFPKLAPTPTSSSESGQKNGHHQEPLLPAVASAPRFAAGVDSLPGIVPQSLRALIAHGHDPEKPTRFVSRSECTWFVLCELVRVGLKDDEIAAIVTDPQFGVSEHMLAQKNLARALARQIERAKEHAIDPMLPKFNDRFAVIKSIRGKCRVVFEVEDHKSDRTRIELQSFADFHNAHSNLKVKVGSKKDGSDVTMPAGLWWTTHANRRQFETMVFAPNQVRPNAYNLWRGFACEPVEGDCSLYLQHLHEIVCSGNQQHYDYLVRWMARAVQFPGVPGKVGVVLKGRQGAGKGVAVQGFGSLFGRHFVHVSDSQHLVGNFNAHLMDCVVLFADEAFWANDKKRKSVLKTLVTEDTLIIERKGFDVEAVPSCIHLIFASNEAWAVPVEASDRRFFVLDVSDAHVRDAGYFKTVHAHLGGGGREALLHHLMHLDISSFDVRDYPQTRASATDRALSMDAEHAWWFEKLVDGEVFAGDGRWNDRAVIKHLVEDFVAFSRQHEHGRGASTSPTKLGLFLRRMVPDQLVKVRLSTPYHYKDASGLPQNLPRARAYLLPDLSVCRDHWRDKVNSNETWEGAEVGDDVQTPFDLISNPGAYEQ